MPTLTIAISSRALFDLDESHKIYENQGVDAFGAHQRLHETEILKPGPAYGLVQKLLSLNTNIQDPPVEVLLISRNTADTGLRIFHSIAYYGLNIKRAAFAGGENPHEYAKAFGAHLFLSMHPEDVLNALHMGCAAATIWPGVIYTDPVDKLGQGPLRIALDGDSVIFSDEAERLYQDQGLHAFNCMEVLSKNSPLPAGPFMGFLKALQTLQGLCPGQIRTALVTARSAPAHERVIKTLRAWNIKIDEALFLGGLEKGAFLSAFGADIFFDDQPQHCLSAAKQNIASGHVPYGVINDKIPASSAIK